MRTATARSSFKRPFSSSLSDVTESLAMNPILAIRWRTMKCCTSAKETKRAGSVSLQSSFYISSSMTDKQAKERTLEFDDAPHDLVDLLDVHVGLVLSDRILLLKLEQPDRHCEVDKAPVAEVSS